MTTSEMWCFGAGGAFDVVSDAESLENKVSQASMRILRIGNIANNARLAQKYTDNGAAATAVLSSTIGREDAAPYTRWVGQPTDVAMLDLLDKFNEHDARESVGPRVTEIPFSSERKWMGVTIGSDAKGDKEYAYMKGSIEKVLAACDTYLERDGREIVLDSSRRQEALAAAETMAAKGLRYWLSPVDPLTDWQRDVRRLGHTAVAHPGRTARALRCQDRTMRIGISPLPAWLA